MTDESLETVAEELEDITIESAEDVYYDGLGNQYSIDNPLPVQIVEPSSDDESSEEEITIRYFGEETEADPVVLEDVTVYKSASRASSVSDFKNLWKLEIGNQNYDVLFPSESNLEVVDGKLYNMGTSNISGLVVDSTFSDSSYSRYTITVLPVASTNTQNTVYRYGSRIYLTSYSIGSQNTLVTNVQYVQPNVISRPAGWSLAPADMVIAGLLLLSCLISLFGGLFRR